MWTVLLLICSNIFMTIAWYGHLRFRNWPLWGVIVGSWLIAFFEYVFQVPANRIGYGQFSATQLKAAARNKSTGHWGSMMRLHLGKVWERIKRLAMGANAVWVSRTPRS